MKSAGLTGAPSTTSTVPVKSPPTPEAMKDTPMGKISSNFAWRIPSAVTVIVVAELLVFDTDTPPVVTQFLKVYPVLGVAVIDVGIETLYQPLTLSTVPPLPVLMLMLYCVM